MAEQKLSTEIRRQQIIQAALKIVSQKGVSSFTTSEIAKEVGISEATIFRHFDRKEEILEDAVLFIRNSLLEKVRNIFCENLRPQEKIKKMLMFHLSFLEEQEGMPKIIFSEQLYLSNDKIKAIMQSTMQEYGAMIKETIQQGIEQGLFKRDIDVEIASRAYIGLIHVSVMKWSYSDYRFSIKEQWQPIFDFIIKSITKE